MEASADLRVLLGPVGIWASLDAIPVDEVVRFAATVEELDFATLWVNESTGREPFAVLGALARVTSRLTLGLGIASVYARDAAAARGSVARYLGQPNDRANLLRGGITEAETDALADSLVHALVATGDATELRSRIAEMHAAGADHVAVVPLSPAGRQAAVATARAIAPAG